MAVFGDLYDPTSYLRQANPLLGLGLPRQPKLPDLPADEAEGLLSRAGGALAGGASFAAKTLGKAFGGRALRGLLGGNLRELASVIPFSDTVGLTDETQEVTGEDLAKKWGWIGEGTKGTLEARDFVGPALEAVLDPGTYLTIGSHAINPLGQAAKKLGVLPKSMSGRIAGLAAGTQQAADLAAAVGKPLAEVEGKALGGVAGLGLPFANPLITLGEGKGGAYIADKLGRVYDKALYSGPGRSLSALFDPDVKGITDATTQRSARNAADSIRKAHVEAVGKRDALIGQAVESGVDVTPDTLRAALEGTIEVAPESPIGKLVAQIRSDNAGMNALERSWGINATDLADREIEYATRHLTPLAKETPGYEAVARKNLPVGHPNLRGREDVFRHWPEGTAGINRASVDPRLSGPNRFEFLDSEAGLTQPVANARAADIIRDEYFHLNRDELSSLQKLARKGQATPEQLQRLSVMQEMWDVAPQAAHYFGTLDPVRATLPAGQGALFRNNPIVDYGMRAQGHARSVENAKVAYNALAGAAAGLDQAGPGARNLAQVLLEALPHNTLAEGGVELARYLKPSLEELPELARLPEGSLRRMVEALQAEGKLQSLTPQGMLEELGGLYVPRSTSEAVLGMGTPLQAPAGLDYWLRKADNFTNLFKVLNTSVWPSKVARDFVQSNFSNAAGIGTFATAGALPDIAALRQGKVIGDAARKYGLAGLSDLEATKALADEASKHGVLQGMLTQGGEAVGHGPHMASVDFKLPGPGNPMTTLADYAKTLTSPMAEGKQGLNPFAVKGVLGRNQNDFWLAKAGQQLEQVANDTARGGGYLALRRQGWTPEAAAAEIARLHGGANLTDIERSVMRRLIPFYGFLKHNTPMVANEVFTRPGGLMAMAMKGASGLRSNDGFLPEYLGEGLALPIGTEDNGQQRYLTRFDLPFEAAFDPIGGGSNRIRRTLANVLAQGNPLLKLPLELATGQQLYTGRDLGDLYGPTGNVEVDQLIMNSPLSRAYTAGRTLLDPRKDLFTSAINLLSPARISDVDLAKARITEGAKLIKEELKTNPAVKNFEEISIPADRLGQLSPQEVELFRLYRYLQKQQLLRSKQAKIGIHQ